MDRAVDASAPEEGPVCGIYDRVNAALGDIASDDEDFGQIVNPQSAKVYLLWRDRNERRPERAKQSAGLRLPLRHSFHRDVCMVCALVYGAVF